MKYEDFKIFLDLLKINRVTTLGELAIYLEIKKELEKITQTKHEYIIIHKGFVPKIPSIIIKFKVLFNFKRENGKYYYDYAFVDLDTRKIKKFLKGGNSNVLQRINR